MRQLLIQQSFSSGEISPTLRGQVDLQKRAEALELCKNLIPLKQGPIVRRGGFEFLDYNIGYQDTGGTQTRPTFIYPFQSSINEDFIIKFSFDYYSDRTSSTPNLAYIATAYDSSGKPATRDYGSWTITGMTNATTGVFTYSSPSGIAPYNTHPIENNLVYIAVANGTNGIVGKSYRIRNINTGARTFNLWDGVYVDTTNSGTLSGSGTMRQIEYIRYLAVNFPYVTSVGNNSSSFFPSLTTSSIIQVGDTLYIFGTFDSAGRATALIYRPNVTGSDGKWTFSALTFQDGPYLDQNANASAQMTVSSGLSDNPAISINGIAVSLINQGQGFVSNDVGRLIRWRPSSGGTWSWYRIDSITSSTIVQTTRLGSPPYTNTSSSVSSAWRLGVYTQDSYPTASTLFQNRVVLSGAKNSPDRVDMSITGGYTSNTIIFSPTELDGTVTDDKAVSMFLDSNTLNPVSWLYPDTTGLAVGTTDGEWVVTSSTGDRIVTPSAKESRPISYIGSQRYVQPVRATSSIVFPAQQGSFVYDLTYAYEIEKLKPRDLSVLSDTLIEGENIIQLTFQPDPYNIIWALTDKGNLYGCTYFPEGTTFGWFRTQLGDASSKVSSIAVMPTDNSLWASVFITCDFKPDPIPPVGFPIGQFNLVRLRPPFSRNNTISESFYLDHAQIFTSGVAFNTAYGFRWARGKTMRLLLNGKQTTDVVVTDDGRVVFPASATATTAVVGLATSWALNTTEINLQGNRGTTQGRLKRLSNIILKVYNTLGMKYGSSPTKLDEYLFGNTNYTTTTPVLFSGNTDNLPIPWGYDQSGFVYLESDSCYPFMLQAIMTEGQPSEG
jgi:hypothetical protein